MTRVGKIALAAWIALAPSWGRAEDTETSVRLGKPSLVRVSAGPAIALLNGSLGFGFATGAQVHAFGQLYLGVESGFYRWSPTPDNRVSANRVNVIPLLATATYRFTHQSGFHPYLGIAAGGVFASGSLELLNSHNPSREELMFEALFRPGVEIEGFYNVSLFFEPKAGFLGRGNFVFLPELGFSFAL